MMKKIIKRMGWFDLITVIINALCIVLWVYDVIMMFTTNYIPDKPLIIVAFIGTILLFLKNIFDTFERNKVNIYEYDVDIKIKQENKKND
jgi:hypothetical protein